MVCRLSRDNQVPRLDEAPFDVGGKISPKEFFFQPSNSPVKEMMKKNANKSIAICLCNFLKSLKLRADF